MNVLGRINWYTVAAILFLVAMYVTVLDGGVPNFFAWPIGTSAVVSAVLSLHYQDGKRR